jgi:hypothetical protein
MKAFRLNIPDLLITFSKFIFMNALYRSLFLLFVLVTPVIASALNDEGNPPSNPLPPVRVYSTYGEQMLLNCQAMSVNSGTEGFIVEFQYDCGNVTLTMTDANGATMYETTMVAYTGDTLFIDSTDWDSGDYTLTLMSSAGMTYTVHVSVP